MNTCDQCKWWGVAYDPSMSDYFIHLRYKPCEHIGEYVASESGASIDGSEMGVSPIIVTGPKFGCIHWTAKE